MEDIYIMGNMRQKMAILCAKVTSVILRLCRRNGEVFPGLLAGRIDPDLLSRLAQTVRKGVIVTMGTNGKTTTNCLLSHALEVEGNRVLCNRTGANMRNGVTGAFVLATDRNGRIDADYACIEVDEFSAAELLPGLRPVCVVLTNIFRDQLDRYGEVDAVCEKIRAALERVPEAKLVFNCDDFLSASVCMQRNAAACKTAPIECGEGLLHSKPACAGFDAPPRMKAGCSTPGRAHRRYLQSGPESSLRMPACPPDIQTSVQAGLSVLPTAGRGFPGRAVPYGINERLYDSAVGLAVWEGTFCRFCGEKLAYAFFHYGQLGIYHCPGCGWRRPFPDYAAEKIDFSGGSYSFSIEGLSIHMHTDALYNVYNALSAYAALKACRAECGRFPEAAESFDYENSREETFWIRGARVRLFLAKNPVGFQQKISIMKRDKRRKDILVYIDDTAQDGTDISWLWDVDFGCLAKVNAKTILTTGSRRLDMALRFKYEDISCRAVKCGKAAIRRLVRSGTGNLYVIVNYSGLRSINRMLHGMDGSAFGQKGRSEERRRRL